MNKGGIWALKKLSDYLVLSDVDGTLVTYQGVLPDRNREAILRFTQKGGRFGIATGRSKGLFLDAARGLQVNAPCILYNGGAVYDPMKDEMLMELVLPQEARRVVLELADMFPDAGVMVISEDTYFQVRNEAAMANFVETRDQTSFQVRDIDDLNAPWYKAMFLVHEEQSSVFFEHVERENYPGIRFIATNANLIEMLPEASNKSYAAEQIINMGVVERENLVAIGDYYNDLDMIKMAGIGVTVAEAPEDIRAAADLVMGPCAQGAVADLLAHLEQQCGV